MPATEPAPPDTQNTRNEAPPSEADATAAVTPDRHLAPWVLLLPLALLAGLLWQAGRGPGEPPADEPGPTTLPHLMPAGTTTPTAAPIATAAAAPLRLTVIFPNDDGVLQPHAITDAGVNPAQLPREPKARFKVLANRVVPRLLKTKNFPPGSALAGPVQRTGNLVQLNLNRKFADSDLWASEKATEVAVYALTDSLAAINMKAGSTTLEPIRVEFLIEGKPLHELGGFDLSDPLEPRSADALPQRGAASPGSAP